MAFFSGINLLAESPEQPDLRLDTGIPNWNKRLEVCRLEGSEKPSLSSGFSPVTYTVTRSKADYQRAQRSGSLFRYTLRIDATWDTDHEPHWGEVDMTRLWAIDVLLDPKTEIYAAWWDGRWTRVLRMRGPLENVSAEFELEEDELSGRPHILVRNKGKWIRPEIYLNSVKGSIFETIQDVQAKPLQIDEELAKSKDALGASPLQYIASWGSEEWISMFGPEAVKRPWWSGRSEDISMPLALAAMHGHSAVVEKLIGLGADVGANDIIGFDAGHFAALYGHLSVMEILLEHGYSPNSSASDAFMRPLSLAFAYGRDDIFGLIWKEGGELWGLNRSIRDELLASASKDGNPEIIRYLLTRKANPNDFLQDGWTCLNLAISSGNPNAVYALFEGERQPDLELGNPPLVLACKLGLVDVVEFLLSKGADPDSSRSGSSAMKTAIFRENEQIVDILLEAGASLDFEVTPGIGYVEAATLAGRQRIVTELFKAGAQCRMSSENAALILSVAIYHDIAEMVILAYEKCVASDFQLYDEFPIRWVAEYYKAEQTLDWLESSKIGGSYNEPQFVNPKDLDSRPRIVQGKNPEYPAEFYERYGNLETKVDMIIDEKGIPRFPKFEESLPSIVRMSLSAAIERWRFSVPEANGVPCKIQIRIPIKQEKPEVPVFEFNELQTPPRPIATSRPYCPLSLRKQKFRGLVELEFVVDTDGKTKSFKVVRSTHPFFSHSSVDAVRKWRFEPATKGNEPVNCRVRQKISFNID